MLDANVGLKQEKIRCETSLKASAVKDRKSCHLQMTLHATNWQDYATCY